jgi:hypothetical protein
MTSLRQEYLRAAGGDRLEAAERLARRLMESDPPGVVTKVAYTPENALLAAIAVYPELSEDERIGLMDRLDVEGRWLDIILRAKDPMPEPDFRRAGEFDRFTVERDREEFGWRVVGYPDPDSSDDPETLAIIDGMRDALKVKLFFEAYREAQRGVSA